MTKPASVPNTVAVVLGCGEIGSAVAHALHRAGLAVALADEADPSWHRRGMTFTNAWYVGNAELESEGACFCASLKSIPSVLARRMIAATTWSWRGVAAYLQPDLLIDARGRKRRGTDALVGAAALSIGIGSGCVDGQNVDVAIPNPCDVPGVSGFVVEAPRDGRFMTERRIGDIVRAGQVIGGLGNEPVAAPIDGVLLGVSARGARVESGDRLVEIDPDRLPHRCYGIDIGSRELAASVLSMVAARLGPPQVRNLRVDATRRPVIPL